MPLTKLGSTRDFFRIWFLWKKQAILTFFLIVGVVMIFSYVYPATYISSAKIVLLPRTSEGAIISTKANEDRIATASLEDINTEIELLTSDQVIVETVRSFAQQGGMALTSPEDDWLDLILAPIKTAINEVLIFLRLKERLSPFDSNVLLLKNSLEAEPIARSNIILVSLTSEVPAAAKKVLDRLLDIYIKHHNETFTKEDGVQFFDEQSAKYRKSLEESEKKLSEFQKHWNIVDMKRQKEADISMLSDLEQELKQVEILASEVESKVALLGKGLEGNKNEILITKEMRTIPAIVELEKSIVPLLVKRNETLTLFTPSSREYQDIRVQIAALRQEVRNEVRKAVQTEKLELEALQTKAQSIKSKIAQLQDKANLLGEKEGTLADLQREVELQRNNYMLYSAKAEDARIYSERNRLDLANVGMADKASIPVKPDFPNRLVMLVLSLLAGSIAAVGMPFVMEFMDHRIKSANAVEDLLSLPVVCSFPEMRI